MDAEKALEWTYQEWPGERDGAIGTIREALKRSTECEKEIQRLKGEIFLKDDYKMCSEQWIKQYKDDIFELRERDKAATDNYNLMREHLERKMQRLIDLLTEAQGCLEIKYRGQTGLDLTKTRMLTRIELALKSYQEGRG